MSPGDHYAEVPVDRLRELREAEAQRDWAVAALREIELRPHLAAKLAGIALAKLGES